MTSLHVLVPALAQAGVDPPFRAWLAHGDRLADVPHARTAVVRERFHFNADVIPAAALRHHNHAEDADAGVWLCADPAHVRSEATGARLVAWPILDLAMTEAAQLAEALRPLFVEAGMRFCTDLPSAWCLRLADGPSSVAFVPPQDALGADLLECLPRGDSGRKWRRLFNEAQIALHAHPVNVTRVTAGKPAVNALWFWGEGPLPDSVETGLQSVASADDVLRGLAKLSGVARLEPAPEALDAAHGCGDALLDLDMPGQLADWLASFQQWLCDRRFDSITLTFASGERYRVRHAHRLRFWRRG